MKKIFAAITAITFFISALSAFDWPQTELNEGSISSDFAQNKGGLLSPSMIFSDPAEVYNVENGHLLLTMHSNEDEGDFFPTALGTSVIIAHNDNLISVYANLDDESLEKTETSVPKGQKLGSTGNTGWQEVHSSLEFQILDSKKSSALNPKVLMNRLENETAPAITKIMIQNKEGQFFNLNDTKFFPSGMYRVYAKRDAVIVPYKTNLTMNGVTVDQISYDTISQENNKIYVSGKKKYTSSDVYPNSELILLGEAMFSKGKATFGIAVQDFLNDTKQLTYIVTAY
ncbi:MAG: M23 family metallopeptidase [Treponema sp.]|nr:M23 family metallopeptidase [Treponema sp.]